MMKPGGNTASRLLRPFQEFAQAETSSGIVLLACTLIALIWANSPWAESYFRTWEIHLSLRLGGLVLDESLHAWINDGLMTLFFFLVGLELKRELLVGELSSLKQSLLPLVAAIGGVLLPALIYTLFNAGGPGAKGWGIPMATDIAFALGILALLGKRVPTTLKIFLTAFAIFDDILAVLTIALFYTTGINTLALLIAAVLLLCLIAVNLLGIRNRGAYIILGLALWLAVLQSGVHATIAGILLAIMIPARGRIDAQHFLENGRNLLNEFERAETPGIGLFMSDQQQTAVRTLESSCEQLQAPSQRIEHALHYPVAFFVVPLFVLSNAGINLHSGSLLANLVSPVSLGVLTGLIVGKQIGITLFSWIAVKLRWAELPQGVSWLHIYGTSWLGAIGFTMSLFIDSLAFEVNAPELLYQAKLGILLAALIAGCAGYFILLLACHKHTPD